jgi:hypothetical protein
MKIRVALADFAVLEIRFTLLPSCLSEGRMKIHLLSLLTVLVLLSSAGRAFAHHSFAATYDPDGKIKIEGTVKEFIWRNPHSFIKIEAPDDKGTVQIWTTEWAAPTQLSESHLTRTSLKPGDKVVVIGQPGRDVDAHRIRVTSVTRPLDGWKWEGVIR